MSVKYDLSDLRHYFLYSNEMVLTDFNPNLVILSIKNIVLIVELTVLFEDNIQWAHQEKLGKYEYPKRKRLVDLDLDLVVP